MSQIHLTNHNFSSSLTSSFCSLLTTSSLCDCTLICSDGQLSAHKVILAATSTFFSSLFSLHHHHHTMIYLRGVRTDLMQAVLMWMYSGECTMEEEDVSSFLELATDLGIKGMETLDKENFEVFKKHTEKENKNTDVHEQNISNYKKRRGKKRRISCTEVSSHSDITVENIKQLEEKNVKESDRKLKIPDNTLVVTENISEAELATDPQGEAEQCLKNDMVFIALQPESELIKTETQMPEFVSQEANGYTRFHTRTNTHELIPKPVIRTRTVYCPVCKMTDRMNLNLKDHMRAKRDVQCENCMLYFSNCNTLSVHMSGRCRNKRNKTK